ncbi:hypothetical protein NIES4103_34050 [Nostoc sp. NIES-4103]|nr:hypothetical protein NIES4103_34050 [Nostoc sp. NIES-4103]
MNKSKPFSIALVLLVFFSFTSSQENKFKLSLSKAIATEINTVKTVTKGINSQVNFKGW